MEIKLKQMIIINFKGVHRIEIDFKHITNILGDNAKGKTTVFDAFTWLLFGKDSSGVSQFNVQRLDENGKIIEKQNAEVEAIFHIDNAEVAVKRVFKEKYTQKRGEPKPVKTGNETEYFWNDVPMKESEYKSKIATIIDEEIFKTITNPFHFSSKKWELRRQALIDIVGGISNEEIIAGNPALKKLLSLISNKTVEEYKREVAAKKKKIKEELEHIPTRIDELRRSMPDTSDFPLIRKSIEKLDADLKNIESQISNKSIAIKAIHEKNAQHQQAIFNLKSEKQNIEFEAKQQASSGDKEEKAELDKTKRLLADKESEYSNYISGVSRLQKQLEEREVELDALRNKYAEFNEEELEFNDNNFICPACNRQLEEHNIRLEKEQLISNFNLRKKIELDKIMNLANGVKNEISTLEARIENGKSAIVQSKSELDILKDKLSELNEKLLLPKQSTESIIANLLSANIRYGEINSEIAEEESLIIADPEINDSELREQKSHIQQQINELNKQLGDEAVIERTNKRIKELSEDEEKLTAEIMELEGNEYLIQQFTKTKIDALEGKINGRFKYVRFRLFDMQINGAEVECCETLINGVPFADANNAAKINAGVDIINTLCKHYNVYAPVFLDNRESVVSLIDTPCQLVNLIVSEHDKKLRVA
jgi:exonuclease SbcC